MADQDPNDGWRPLNPRPRSRHPPTPPPPPPQPVWYIDASGRQIPAATLMPPVNGRYEHPPPPATQSPALRTTGLAGPSTVAASPQMHQAQMVPSSAVAPPQHPQQPQSSMAPPPRPSTVAASPQTRQAQMVPSSAVAPTHQPYGTAPPQHHQQPQSSMAPPPRPATAPFTDPPKPTFPPRFITSMERTEAMSDTSRTCAKLSLGRDLIHLEDTVRIALNKVKLFREILTSVALRHIEPPKAYDVYRIHTRDMLESFDFLANSMVKVEVQFRNLYSGGGVDIKNTPTLQDLGKMNLREVSFDEWSAVLENAGFMPLVANRINWLDKWMRLVAYAWVMTHQFVEGSKTDWIDWKFSKEGRLRMWEAVNVFVLWGEEALRENLPQPQVTFAPTLPA